jgi:hypothetical protein
VKGIHSIENLGRESRILNQEMQKIKIGFLLQEAYFFVSGLFAGEGGVLAAGSFARWVYVSRSRSKAK